MHSSKTASAVMSHHHLQQKIEQSFALLRVSEVLGHLVDFDVGQTVFFLVQRATQMQTACCCPKVLQHYCYLAKLQLVFPEARSPQHFVR